MINRQPNKPMALDILAISLPTLLLCLAILELVIFRVAIPAAQTPCFYFDRENQMLTYDPKRPSEGTYTMGKLAQFRASWRVNNFGWNSEIDYKEGAGQDGPLIAIIGDSYVAARQVNVADSLTAVLRRKLADQCMVYGFGIPGAPLSHYLHVCRYVKKYFDPQILVFVVVHNDFDECLWPLYSKWPYMQLSITNGKAQEARPVSYEPTKWQRLLRRSSLLRYLFLNCRLRFFVFPRTRAREESLYNANIEVNVAKANSELIKIATNYVVSAIRRENPNAYIFFMIDAPRRDIYEERLESSNVSWLHDILRDACSKNNVHFVDLTEHFAEYYTEHGEKLNSPVDYHWNEVGHKEAAKVLLEQLRSRCGTIVARGDSVGLPRAKFPIGSRGE